MKVISGDPDLCLALHVLLTVPPLVNYLTSELLAADVVRKKANAVAFTLSLRELSQLYWSAGDHDAVDATEACKIFRRCHRAVAVSSTAAVRHMYQLLCEAAPSFFSLLQGTWLVHQPDCAATSVQQLVNAEQIVDAPELVFVRLDRGDRVRKFINYGTTFQMVQPNKSNPKLLTIHTYDLFSVLMQGDETEKDRVIAKSGNVWMEITTDTVSQLTDLNHLITTRAQVLVFLLRH